MCGQEDFIEWIYSLKKPLEYLKAVKRVHLSKSMRQKLQDYKNAIGNFDRVLAQECTDCLIKYETYISSNLKSFPNIPASMLITVSMNELVDSKIKIAILNKRELSLIDDFTCIDFVKNDEPENYKNTAVQINDDIRNQWGAINYGLIDISYIEDKQVRLSCELLDFIDQNITNEKETLNEILDDTQSAEYLLSILELLDAMIKGLVKRIDKITN